MMKVYNILAVICLASIAKAKKLEIAPKFTLVEERNENGVPSVAIIFPNGHNDILLLDKFYANEEDRMIQGHDGIPNVEQCVYFGHLANEPEACVAMTGCVGSDDVEFTIFSAQNKDSHMYKWTKEGNVHILSRTNNDDDSVNEDSFIPRNKTDYDDADAIPEIEEAFIQAQQSCSGGTCSLPATQHLQIRVGYDNTYLNHFNGNHLSAKGYVTLTWAHIQAYYCQPSLGSKIYVERLPGIKHYNEDLPGDDNHKALKIMLPHTEKDLGSADLMLYMGLNCNGPAPACPWGGGRVSAIGIVCKDSAWNKYKQSINNWGSSYAMLGESMAHEIGHQLGIHHDHDTRNGGTGNSDTSTNDCNGKGLMSYGHHLRVWSSCSKANFEAYYATQKNNWCMPEYLENVGKDCWTGCNQKEGKCDWCGSSGWCCRKNWSGNGCDGSIGGPFNHQCVSNPVETPCGNVPAPTDTGCGTYDNTNSCCTQQNPCNKGEGDCDNDHDCKGHLVCGDDNCFHNLGFPGWGDCCAEPTQAKSDCHYYDGTSSCCTKENPCNTGEGDCDYDHDCVGNLVCGTDNCHDTLGFPSWGDCCKES